MRLFLWYNGNKHNNYIHPRQYFATIILSSSMFVLLILSIGVSFHFPVFAQTASTAANKNIANIKNFAASSPSVNQGHAPIITNISSKGIYEVQLAWDKPVSIRSLPHDWQTHIFFMNATGHPATMRTIPNKTAKSGGTTVGVGTQYRVPGSIKRLLPASSFDMTIYGKHGKVLWNKVNEPVTGGVGLEKVVFPMGYTGDITILIHNIKSYPWLQ